MKNEFKHVEKKVEELKEAKTIENRERKIIKISALISGGVVLLLFLCCFAAYPFIPYLFGNYKVYIDMYNVKEFKVPDGVKSI